MLGFETIGNATLIGYDGAPVLVTDPWIEGPAYFGSWTVGYEIPPAQRAAIAAAPFVWYSHGHPDHLHADSLASLSGKEILLPDHVGGRIARDLTAMGLKARVLPDRVWVPLSDRIRVLCVSDYFQDGILYVEIGGTLIMNVNDSAPRGHADYLRRLARPYARRILLKTFGYGDIDMMNIFDADDVRIAPAQQTKAREIGSLAGQLRFWGRFYDATEIIPFSSFHEYQRSDSVWAAAYTTPLDAFYRDGCILDGLRIHPAFVRCDVEGQDVVELAPARSTLTIQPPETFGDNWSDQLEAEDVALVTAYFQRFERLGATLDFIELGVGGKTTRIAFAPGGKRRGLRFEVPRASLMTAVRYDVFDDLMIGNFMRTKFLGEWPRATLEGFTPVVSKYGDNGGARSEAELRAYFAAYRARFPADYLKHRFGKTSERLFRGFLRDQSPAFQLAKKAYVFFKS